MKPQKISLAVEERISQAIGTDRAYDAAERRFYAVMNRIGKVAGADLEHELDEAWVDVFRALQQVAWLDGYHVGRNPDLLVYEPEPEPEPQPDPMPLEWVTVPGAAGVAIGLTADAAIAAFLAGGRDDR